MSVSVSVSVPLNNSRGYVDNLSPPCERECECISSNKINK